MGVMWCLAAQLPVAAAPTFKACTGAVLQEGKWTVLEPPAFEHTGIATLSGEPIKTFRYALDPVDRRVVFISNNEIVKRSEDGGCTWEEVFRIDAMLTASAPGAYCAQNYRPATMRFNCTVTSIDLVRQSRGAPGRVYLQVSSIPTRPDWLHMRSPFGYADTWAWMALLPHQPSHGYAISWTFVSDDGGESWNPLNAPSTGLETRAGHGDLVVHPDDPMTLYLVRHATPDGEVPGHLLKSEDGGETWSVKGPLPAVNELSVNPYQPGDLWALSPLRGLLHSTDDGGSWAEVPGPYSAPTDMDVFFDKSATAVALGEDERRTIDVTFDGGETWVSHELGTHLFGVRPIADTPRRVPFVGYWQSAYSVEIAFGASSRTLFVSANSGQGWVGRMDTRTGSMPFAREPLPEPEQTDERGTPDDDGQARLDRTPGVGVSLLQHCYANYTCSKLAIYRGPGA